MSDDRWARVLLDALDEGYTLQGPAGDILAANPAACRILGLSLDELTGRTSLDPRWRVVHEDGTDWGGGTHPAMLALTSGVPQPAVPMGVHRPDGSLVWIEATATPLAVVDGRVSGVVTSFRDVTAARATQAKVLSQQQLLVSALGATTMGVLVEAPDGTVDLANQALLGIAGAPDGTGVDVLLGAAPERVAGMLAGIMAPERYLAERAAALAVGTDLVADEVVLDDGRVVERDLHRIPTPQGDEVMWVYRDVTERARVQELLRRARDDAEEASAAKTAFLSSLSHEVRTPVHGIVGLVDLMLELPLDPELREIAEGVRASTDGLTVLLEDLLDVVRIEAGQLELKEVEVGVRDLVERCVAAVGPRARERRLALACRVAPDVPSSVHADPARLRQVLVGLVDEAVRATAPGGAVALEVRSDDGGLHVAIQDGRREAPAVPGVGHAVAGRVLALMEGRLVSGPDPSRRDVVLPLRPGLPPAARPRELAGRRLRVVGGTPGLDPVVALVTRLLGDAGAEAGNDAPGVVVVLDAGAPDARAAVDAVRGSAARAVVLSTTAVPPEVVAGLGVDRVVVLPAGRDKIVDAVTGVAPRSAAGVVPLAGGRVLVAEDSAVNRAVLVRMLQVLGVEADAVEDGEEAVEAARARAYDLVLMDLNMPRLDGISATRALRADRRTADLPVVALTAAASHEDERRCLEAGMAGFVPKPVELATLRQTLVEHLPGPGAAGGGQPDPRGPVLDAARLDALAEELGSAAMVVDVVDLYLAELPGRRDRLVGALAADDREGARFVAHALASSSAMLGAQALARVLRELEATAPEGSGDRCRELLDEARSLLDPTLESLGRWRAAHA